MISELKDQPDLTWCESSSKAILSCCFCLLVLEASAASRLHFFCSLSVLTCMCASTRSHSMLLSVGHAAPRGTEGLSGCHDELLNVALSDVTSRRHGTRPLWRGVICSFVAVMLEKVKRNDWLVIQILSTLGYVVLRGQKELTKINSLTLKEIRARLGS